MINNLVSYACNAFFSDMYRDFDSLKDVKRVPIEKSGSKIRSLSIDKGMDRMLALKMKGSNVVSLFPHNNTFLKRPVLWYDFSVSEKDPILTNHNNFMGITNLAEILDKATEVMEESYERQRPVLPFLNFGIELTEDIKPFYRGKGDLVLITGDFLKHKYRDGSGGAHAYFANEYLDEFMGYNYGGVIRDNPDLGSHLLEFNNRLISDEVKSTSRPSRNGMRYLDGQNDCFYEFPHPDKNYFNNNISH